MIHLLFLKQHAVKNTYKNAFIMYHPTILVNIYAFAISYAIFMHLGSSEEITLLEFDEGEEGDQQEIPQAVVPEEEEQTLEELPECPDHRPHFFSERQAPKHSKSPSILQNITRVLYD